jgi:16S rRNA (guanine966-N2)-methyltransferase
MKNRKPGTVRIIGGRWRGTRLPVPDLPGLRPSGDRGRETLFNWLQAYIHGARCVDLFAGSGVLGLEAVSRGAGQAILVEKSRKAVRVLFESVDRLKTQMVEVVECDALTWLASCKPQTIDIVFIDPPFGAGLEVRTLELLTEGKCVGSGGLAYLETARETPPIPACAGWEILRDKTLGEVRMQLLNKV